MPTRIHSSSARSFGERVKDRRVELGLSQEKLAERSGGRHRNYVGSVERGERNVSLMVILNLAVGLEVDPADLVRGLAP